MSHEPGGQLAVHGISRVALAGSTGDDSVRRLNGGDRIELELRVHRKCDLLAVISAPAFFQKHGPDLWVELDGLRVPHSLRNDLNPPCLLVRMLKQDPHVGETRLALGGAESDTPAPNSADAGHYNGEFLVSVFPVEPALPFSSWATLLGRLARRVGIGNAGLLADGFPYAWFDGLGYLEANPDVAQALARGEITSALAHYLQFGRKSRRRLTIASARKPNEGRLADCFDGAAYLARYPDIQEAVRLETMPSALHHFMRHGRREGRRINMRFDQRVMRGTAVELARKEITESCNAAVKRAHSEVSRARAELLDVNATLLALQKRLTGLNRNTNERVEQVQAQLLTLARARQAREREILSRLEALEAESAAQATATTTQTGALPPQERSLRGLRSRSDG